MSQQYIHNNGLRSFSRQELISGFTNTRGQAAIITLSQIENDSTVAIGRAGPSGATGGGTRGPRGHFSLSAPTGPTGHTGTQLKTQGPTGSSSSSSTGSTGPTGFMGNYLGYTGPGGDSVGLSITGPTGSVHSIGSVTGPTGPNSSEMPGDTGATGPAGPVIGNATGPTGSGTPFLPIPLLAAQASIISAAYSSDGSPNPVLGNITYNSSTGSVIWGGDAPEFAQFGLPMGWWKIIFSIEWDSAGGAGGSRQLYINNITTEAESTLAENSTSADGSTVNQQLIWSGALNQTTTLGFYVYQDSGQTMSIAGGSISLFSYDIAVPSNNIESNVPLQPYEFLVRIVNHDLVHPPLQLAMLYENQAGNQGLYCTPSLDPLRPTQGLTITPMTGVSTMFLFDWSSMTGPDANTREFILGGPGVQLNSGNLWIAKTDILNNPSTFNLWTANVDGLTSSPPQSYVESYPASTMTLDFVELSYNDSSIIFIDTTMVTAFNIPMTVAVNYKTLQGGGAAVLGSKAIMNGPVGITTDMQTMLTSYTNLSTGSVWYQCLVPGGNPCRITAPQKLISPLSGWNTYYDNYVQLVWNTWMPPNDPLTFYSRNEATFTSATVSTDSSTMFVTSIGGTAGFPPTVSFTIPINLVLGHSLDIFGCSQIWATAAGFPASDTTTILKVKAYLVAAFARGVINMQDTLTGGLTGTIPGGFYNSVWNAYGSAGKTFYQNTPAYDLYCKFFHDNSILGLNTGTIDVPPFPYAYALSFDDVWNWSTTLSSPSPPLGVNDSTIQICQIDVYSNNNY